MTGSPHGTLTRLRHRVLDWLAAEYVAAAPGTDDVLEGFSRHGGYVAPLPGHAVRPTERAPAALQADVKESV